MAVHVESHSLYQYDQKLIKNKTGDSLHSILFTIELDMVFHVNSDIICRAYKHDSPHTLR